jgi:hypothetical protein
MDATAKFRTRSQAFTKGQSCVTTIVGHKLCVSIRKVPRLSLIKYVSARFSSLASPDRPDFRTRTRIDIHTKPGNVRAMSTESRQEKPGATHGKLVASRTLCRRRVFRSSAIVRNAEGDAWEIFHFLPGGRDCIETSRASIKSARNRWSAVATPRVDPRGTANASL